MDRSDQSSSLTWRFTGSLSLNRSGSNPGYEAHLTGTGGSVYRSHNQCLVFAPTANDR